IAGLVKDMKLTTAQTKDSTVITAVDPQNKKDPNKLIFTFTPDNRLKNLKVFASNMVSETEYVYGPVNGSLNKVVLLSSTADVQMIVPTLQRHLVETKIEYGLVNNVVLPEKVTVKTMVVDGKYPYPTPVSFPPHPKNNDQFVENVLTFTKYKANGQEAANFYKKLDLAQKVTPTPIMPAK
ncbi:MAG: hypothetical protein J6Y94_03905, partial [Bacteriovoracaceae bacterium]|nr:hypothetical protein [Bacteriovoracaceae bacterium]